MSKPKVKTRKEALEALWDQTMIDIAESEVKIALLEKKQPDEVVFNQQESFLGKPFNKEYTAQMLIDKEKDKWRGNMEVLETIKELLKKAK